MGRLVTRVTTDVDALNDLFTTGVAAMVNDVFLLVLFVFIMLQMNWRLALATFAVMPLIFLSTWIFRNRVRDANRRIRTAIARINAFLQEHISGMSVIQLFNRERKARAQFAELNRLHMLAYKDAILAFALFYPTVEFLGVVAILTVFWYGGLGALVGAVPIGILIAFMQYAQRFFQPIQDLSEKFNILQTAMTAAERIFKLLDEPLAVSETSPGRPLGTVRGEIEFRNVWFAYRTGSSSKRSSEGQRKRGVPGKGSPSGKRKRGVPGKGSPSGKRRLGAARRLLPRPTGPNRRRRRPHRRRQDHRHPAPAALLRDSARSNPARRRGPPRTGRARFAPPARHRAAGPVPFHRHTRIQCPPGHRKN